MTNQAEHAPFLSLCILASEENWCWNLFCTTCGHMYFRYAFKELANGKHPDSDDWIVIKRHHHAISKNLGEMPMLGGFDGNIQKALVDLVLAVPIEAIKEFCKFPDWLGYLGLVVTYCNQYREKISDVWSKEFLGILPERSDAYNAMVEILSGKRALKLNDLELVEFALQDNLIRRSSMR